MASRPAPPKERSPAAAVSKEPADTVWDTQIIPYQPQAGRSGSLEQGSFFVDQDSAHATQQSQQRDLFGITQEPLTISMVLCPEGLEGCH